MKTIRVRVAGQKEIAKGIFSLWLSCPQVADEAKPGQFVSIYSRDHSRLLPRPISICEVERPLGQIRLVYRVTGPGTGTEEFSSLERGEGLDLLGPLGNGYPLDQAENRHVILVGGGIGIPPLVETAKQLKTQMGCTVTVIAGYRDQLFLTEELAAYGNVFVATEDGSAGTKGTVIDAWKKGKVKGDLVFACGPKPMLKAVVEHARQANLRCFVSMEERMACGIGACLACVCESTQPDPHFQVATRRICKDGPVFESTEVVL